MHSPQHENMNSIMIINHNMPDMNHLCGNIQDLCIRLIKSQRWNQLRSYLSSPKFSDEVGISPMVAPGTLLHIACTMPSVPQDVIGMLLHSFPQAVLLEDEDGALPIHSLCSAFTLRPDLIKMLLNACPETSFKTSREGQELPFYLLITHHIQNFGMKSAFELISTLSPSLIYSDNVSVLHQLHSGMLPEPICHKLLELYPNICSIHRNGNTLLHIICSHPNSTASLIQKIIQICPNNCAVRDDNGNVPLHLVNSQQHSLEIIRMLIAVYPHALLVQNSFGQIPLISPLIRSSSRRVKELLRSCVSTGEIGANSVLQMRNRFGMFPLQDYFYTLQKQITEHVSDGSIPLDSLSSHGRMLSYTKLIANNLESFFYLMRVAIYNDVEYALNAPHQASFWTAFPIFTKTLLHHSPELACHKDCNGSLPLHLIAKHEFQQLNTIKCSYCDTLISGPYLWSNRSYMCTECCSCRNQNPEDLQSALIEYQGNELMKDVLAVNPSAAKVEDAEGNFPLHLSLQSGKTWSTGVKELINAAPFALGFKDKASGLYPFMRAAEFKQSDGTLNPGQKLTTIYELLRRGPSLMH